MADDDIIVGSAAVELVPTAKGWIAKAKAQILPQAEELGRAIGDAISDAISDEVRTALTEGLAGSDTVAKEKGRQSGRDFGGEFGQQAHARIQAALKALPKADVDVDSTEAEIKLAELRAEMEAISDLRIGTDIDAGDALAEMGRLQAELEMLAANDIDIDVRVDTGRAIAELAAFRAFAQTAGGGGVDLGDVAGSAPAVATNLSKAAGSMGKLVAGGIVLSTVIGPIAGAAGGIAAALAAPLGAATIGGALFGGLGMAAVGRVEAIATEIETAKTRAQELTDQAEKLAERAGKATTDASRQSLIAQRDEILKERKALADDAKKLEASLSDGARAYLAAKEGLGDAFGEFLAGPAGDSILNTFADGLDVLAELLPEVEPLIVAVGDALQDALADVDADGFGDWIDKLAELAGPTIDDLVSILGDLGGAIDAVLTSGSDTGESALSGLADAAERLNEYLSSAEGQKELQEFFEWLATDGKDAGEALWDLAGAMTDWFIAVEPLGSALLDVTSSMSELIGVTTELLSVQWNVFSGDLGGALETVRSMGEEAAGSMTGLANVIRGAFRMTFLVIGELFDMMGRLFEVLGNVPGFGWAEEAADMMRGAARQARSVASGLEAIPRNTDPKITLKGHDAALAGINTVRDGLVRLSSGVDVPVRIKMQGVIPNLNDIYAPGKAAGGPVYGPGTGTSDEVLTRLSNGEHVLTAAEVRAAGGHDAIIAMRRAMLSGGLEPATTLVGAGGPSMSPSAIRGAVEQGTRAGMDGARVAVAPDGSLRIRMMGG